jgi:hypothetical protein
MARPCPFANDGTISPAGLLGLRLAAGAQSGLKHHGTAGMKHWHLGLLAATTFFITGSAQAAPDFRVIRWDFTRICQIYDFGWGGHPIPSNYRVLTPPLPSFRAAVRAKGQLARHGRCSI